jgi:hypothetical protein
MKNHLQTITLKAAGSLAALLLATAARAQTYTDISDPNAASAAFYDPALGISGSTVLGDYQNQSGGNWVASLYNNGSFTDIAMNAPGSEAGTTTPVAISGNTIFGTYNNNSDSFEYNLSTSTYTTLPALPSGYNGYVVGASGDNILFAATGIYDGNPYAAVLNNGSFTVTALNPPNPNAPGYISNGGLFGIDGNNIIGDAYDDNLTIQGFVFNNGVYTATVSDPNASGDTFANAISGNLVGGYYSPSVGPTTGFLGNLQTGVYLDVKDPNANPLTGFTAVTGISGTNVAGIYDVSNSRFGGFIVSSTTVPEPAVWTLLSAGAALLGRRRSK